MSKWWKENSHGFYVGWCAGIFWMAALEPLDLMPADPTIPLNFAALGCALAGAWLILKWKDPP